ncbi:condensation domain-containing protein, partial [Actinocrispum wychmicini]|uniref:condensation domain-containing protein n=1 Tax=Actinocrispum wychmicini TaxID=1213861 RepID=UPI001404FCD6
FFTLGGHSLLATRITNQLNIPLHTLFQHPTIAELAHELTGHQRTTIPQLDRIDKNGTTTLPASFGQERLWFLTQLDPQTTTAYHMTGAATLHGPLNTTALKHALHTTTQRHETLRTTLHHHTSRSGQTTNPQATGYTYQSVHAASPTLNHVTADHSQLTDILNHEATHPFNLTQGPLFRATLIHHTHNHHTLIITMHHTISDGWSLTILLREITTAYTALVRGQAAELPSLRVQYADFAAWQRDRLARGELEESISYWRKQLAGIAPLELPTDLPRPARQTFGGATRSVDVGEDLVRALEELARAEGVTVFMVLLAVFHTLLSRVCGQKDVAVGSPISGREHPDVEDLVGFFVNTLVLRADLGGTPSFREVLRRVRQVCLEAYAHQDVPFEKLVEELQPERDLSRSPLFQVMFVVDEAAPQYTMPDLEIHELRPEQRSSQFELTLRLMRSDSGLHGDLVYNTDLFAEDTAQRLADRYVTMLSEVVADPDQRIAELPVMSLDETKQLSTLTRGTDTRVPDLLVHEWFEAQADRTPDATAVRAVDGELTYRQLDQQANQLAHHLRHQHHITPETLVGVCLPRTLDLIVALFAVLKTGAAYVPIDPAYPTNRITYILNDTKAKALITTCDTNVGPYERILVDQTGLTSRLTPTADKHNLAYVIYTSGSTGQPKGVMIEHHQTTAMITWALNTYTTELTNVLASTSVCFDLSIYEIFAPLAAGGSITLTEHNALDLTTNPDLGTNITLINTVPSIAQELMTAEALPASAATINLAGEALSPTLVRALYDQPHVKAVHNLYGPSEDTTYSTHAHTTSQDNRTPIGQPIHNTQAHILDANLRPVPIGSIGELYLSGAGITRGYHNQPTLTAERYLPSPQGQRLYR